MKDWLSIGQFSKQTRVTERALRLYEKMGLIKSATRGENGYRYYRENQISAARKIRELKAIGFSLSEIKSLLESGSEFDTTTLRALLKSRLVSIKDEECRLENQREQIRSILSSLTSHRTALNERERMYVMGLFKTATIVVTGIDDLKTTATY